MSVDERIKIVKDKHGCFKCLRIGHSYKKCHNKEKCPWCGKEHCILLCRNLADNQDSNKIANAKAEEQAVTEVLDRTNLSTKVSVFLPTLRVRVTSSKGN